MCSSGHSTTKTTQWQQSQVAVLYDVLLVTNARMLHKPFDGHCARANENGAQILSTALIFSSRKCTTKDTL
jgi:hypothetical protein